jgi:hypothetical protein
MFKSGKQGQLSMLPVNRRQQRPRAAPQKTRQEGSILGLDSNQSQDPSDRVHREGRLARSEFVVAQFRPDRGRQNMG